MKKTQSLQVAMLGFDERTQKTFEIFFQNTCHGDYVIDRSGVETPIAIVDFDAVKARKTVADLRRKFPQQVVIALSILDYPDDNSGVIFVRKPLDHQAIKQQLTRIKKAIATNSQDVLLKMTMRGKPVAVATDISQNKKPQPQANKISHTTAAASLMTKADDLHFVGENQDIDLSDPAALAKISYALNSRYLAVVIKAVNRARKSRNIVELVCLDTAIAIDPVRNQVLTSTADSRLRPICLLKVEKVDVLREIENDYDDASILSLSKSKSQSLQKISIESFIWKIALWSSRGCLPNGVDINKPVYLTGWPNLTRVENFPHAMRIAALLTQGPVVLREIPQQLNIAQRYVFSFISATSALGILRVSHRKLDQTIDLPLESKKTAPRSLLKKLLGRLISSTHRQAMAS